MSILYTPCSPPHPSPFHRSPNVSVPHCFVLPTPAPLVSCPPCCALCVGSHTSLDKVYKKKEFQFHTPGTNYLVGPFLALNWRWHYVIVHGRLCAESQVFFLFCYLSLPFKMACMDTDEVEKLLMETDNDDHDYYIDLCSPNLTRQHILFTTQ